MRDRALTNADQVSRDTVVMGDGGKLEVCSKITMTAEDRRMWSLGTVPRTTDDEKANGGCREDVASGIGPDNAAQGLHCGAAGGDCQRT